MVIMISDFIIIGMYVAFTLYFQREIKKYQIKMLKITDYVSKMVVKTDDGYAFTEDAQRILDIINEE